MSKKLCLLALAGSVLLTAALCGCNTNPGDTASNGSGNGASHSATSNGGDKTSHSPLQSIVSEVDNLVSPVFGQNQQYS